MSGHGMLLISCDVDYHVKSYFNVIVPFLLIHPDSMIIHMLCIVAYLYLALLWRGG